MDGFLFLFIRNTPAPHSTSCLEHIPPGLRSDPSLCLVIRYGKQPRMDDSDPVNGAPGGAGPRQKLETWKEEAKTVSGERHVEAEPVKVNFSDLGADEGNRRQLSMAECREVEGRS